jgi:xanthine/uracil permease
LNNVKVFRLQIRIRRKMRRAIPIVIGVILLLVGIGWASQGAGMMGGSSLMDNNPTFLYLGVLLAVVGIAAIGFGATMKKKIQATTTVEPPGGRSASNS